MLAVLAAGLVLAACSSAKSPKASTTTLASTQATTTVAGHSTTTVAGHSTTTVAGHSPTTVAGHSTSTTVASTPKTTVAPPPTTIPFSVSEVKTGTGPASLAQFTVPGNAKEWDIDWVFDCTKIAGTTGPFKITVIGHGGAVDTKDAGVTESGHGTSGLERNYDKGTFNLDVATPCTWTVRVEVIT
jgi:hypothetical protein